MAVASKIAGDAMGLDALAIADYQHKGSALPSELWRVVLSRLRLRPAGQANRVAEDGLAGQAELAVAMRVNAEWHDLAGAVLYSSITTSDIPRLLRHIDEPPIPGVRSKRELLGLTRVLCILPPAPPTPTPVPALPPAPDAGIPGPGAAANPAPLAPALLTEHERRIRDLSAIQALHAALGGMLDASDLVPPSVAPAESGVEGAPTPDAITILENGPHFDASGLPARPLAALRTLELQFCPANLIYFYPDQSSGLSAVQTMSPDNLCLHYDGSEEGRDAPIGDPRRSIEHAQSLTFHIDSIGTARYPFPRENRLPLVTRGATRWIVDCLDIEDEVENGAEEGDDEAAWRRYIPYISHLLGFTMLRAPPRWSSLHIDFVLPSTTSVNGIAFIQEMGKNIRRVQGNYRTWLTGVHRDETEGEGRYELRWDFKDLAICRGCGDHLRLPSRSE